MTSNNLSIQPNPIKNRLKSDGLLLFTSAIWGSGFVAQRIASESMGSFTFNGARFGLAALILFALIRFQWKVNRKQLIWTVIAGSLLFGGSMFQQLGIETTSVANASFITSLYVVMIPLALVIFGRQHVNWITWAAVALAVAGTLFLSTGGKFQPAIGDLLEFVGAIFWTGQVIFIGKVSKEMDSLAFTFGQFATCALLNLVFSLFFDLGHTSPLPAAWLSVLYSAIFPAAIGFTLQVIGQRNAPTTDAAIIYSMEAVFGALCAFLFLHEALEPLQVLGCLLILAAIILSQLRPSEPGRSSKAELSGAEEQLPSA